MHSYEHRVGIPPVSLLFLLECPKLQIVKLPIYTRRNDLIDLVVAFRSLKALRSLLFNVHLREELEFLEEQTSVWNPIYRQIGQLPKLQSLTIIYFTIEKGKDSGIQQLVGATSVKRLVLRGCEATKWTREEIQDLVRALPKLENLHLKPLEKGLFSQIKSWLCEAGRSDIIFGDQ
ncbi:hypothetical protein EC957_006446 [Mortierella hygrophila]|uniref:Uncharacterized protein n=1 Tax=Mortierella hygrophila TaxID=979708 RepID=A0A9P6JYK2_9FUNG|nr:hypothetical protein EC957_006446 [Mortierella hygrophila]